MTITRIMVRISASVAFGPSSYRAMSAYSFWSTVNCWMIKSTYGKVRRTIPSQQIFRISTVSIPIVIICGWICRGDLYGGWWLYVDTSIFNICSRLHTLWLAFSQPRELRVGTILGPICVDASIAGSDHIPPPPRWSKIEMQSRPRSSQHPRVKTSDRCVDA